MNAPRTRIDAAACVAQPNPFLQRFFLLRFICGETTKEAALLSRLLEHLGPLDVHEATVIAEGWSS